MALTPPARSVSEGSEWARGDFVPVWTGAGDSLGRITGPSLTQRHCGIASHANSLISACSRSHAQCAWTRSMSLVEGDQMALSLGKVSRDLGPFEVRPGGRDTPRTAPSRSADSRLLLARAP